MSSFAPAVVLEIDGLGAVRFCHGSPRSDMEKLTPFTPDERWADVLGGVAEEVIVCGHTHRQFDVAVGGQRVVNAGSVGLPYEGRAGLPSEGRAGAFWAVLGPEVELRRTDYPWAEALEELRRGGYPGLDELLLESLIQPMDPDEVSRFLES
jgi:diadenosine tetraphosphatase ApaH/serine/threonine PP2A family protein phosphatase